MFRTKKRFGQHFLKDKSVLTNIASYCELKADELCIEIGPGQGALTQYLIDTGSKITAIEIDKRLVPTLDKLKENENFSYILSDVLEVDISDLVEKGKKVKVVGNLPYEISTPLLFKLVEDRAIISKMVFLLQKEVVDRIVANVGSNDYGRLSVMMQYYFKTKALLIVDREAFNPPPKVTSQVVSLEPLEREWVDPKALENFVKLLFLHRRKMLRQRFKGKLGESEWAEIGIEPTRRAQSLSIEEILSLFQYCQDNDLL